MPPEDVDRARRIIWDEAVRIPLNVGFDTALDDYYLAEDVEETVTPNLRREDLIRKSGYAPGTDVGEVLRNDELQRAARLFPIVVEITTVTKVYLDLDQVYKTGHFYDIISGRTANAESHRLFFYARDGGQKVQYTGGFGEAYDQQ